MPKLAVTLQDVEALLIEEGQVNHLNHPSQVEVLEDLLPRKEVEEFLKRNPNYQGGEFDVFKKYVNDRKKEVEALARFGSKYKDPSENETGADKSAEKEEDEKKASDKCEFCKAKDDCIKLKKSTCKKCSEKGHWAKECPQAGKTQEKRTW